MRASSWTLLAAIFTVAAASAPPSTEAENIEIVALPGQADTDNNDLDKRGLLDGLVCLFGSCLSNDVRNCGAPRNVCPNKFPNGGAAQCLNGVCMPKNCNGGYDLDIASASCIPTTGDVNNCGRAGNRCNIANALGHACISGTCVATDCSPGYGLTLGQCQKVYDLMNDPQNCGAINRACSASFANGVGANCVSGMCQPASCNNGFAFSASENACKDVNNDPNNCGGLGRRCSFGNGNAKCEAGACKLQDCNTGFYNVDGSCKYLRLDSDPQNCGAVGQACNFVNGVGQCQGGKCQMASCLPGFKMVGNACQRIDLQSDPSNCGVAGYSCPPSFANGGSGFCVNGKCTTSCNPGYAFDSTLNFCRATRDDPMNCGRIGNVCSAANGIPSCSNGVCGVAACNPGFKMLSGTCQRIDYSCDVRNCGSAGNVCPSSYPNGGTGVCAAGRCYTTCNPGYFFDVDNNYCRDVSLDTSNCGSLGFKCNLPGAAAHSCVAGQCKATACSLGYTLDSSNGVCRTLNTDSDLANCGGVGRSCQFSPGASGICRNGQCIVTSCPNGYYVNSGICTLMPSQRARLAKKDKAPVKKALCPKGETACPIAGSTSFSGSPLDQFSLFDGVDSLDPAGGYECVDTQSALDSCGGCASIGQGQDCNALPHVAGVGCDAGACVIFSCSAGFRPSLDGSKCVKASSHSNSTRSGARRHLHERARHPQRLDSHHIS